MTEIISEAMQFQDLRTGRSILQLTSHARRSLHGYYDLPPWSTCGGTHSR